MLYIESQLRDLVFAKKIFVVGKKKTSLMINSMVIVILKTKKSSYTQNKERNISIFLLSKI